MSLIQVSQLTFGYDGSFDNVFENVSFQIDTDWKLGFIGRNGRGKTTFLRLLTRQYEYKGQIQASVQFDYFPYAVKDLTFDTLHVLENIFPEMLLWQIQKELSFLELDDEVLYRPFETLSFGERTKVMLATLFLQNNHFLLIDEPTDHLDLQAREVVARYLNSKKGFILVSHDRHFLDRCIDHVLSINKNNIEVQKGNFSSWQVNKERQDRFELAENQKLKKEIQTLKEAARRTAEWSDQVEKSKKGTLLSGIKPDKGYIGHKSAKMMQKSKNMESRQLNAIDQKSKLLKNLETEEMLKLHPLKYKQNTLMDLKDVSLCYDGKQIVSDIDLQIVQGDRIAVQGVNGSGKSTLLKFLAGETIEAQGQIMRGSNLSVSYVSQDTQMLHGDIKKYVQENNIEESLFKAILRKLDFSREQFEKDMASFSSGQKKKVLLARSLCERAHLYIWDEPLNYVDVISRMQLENLLITYAPTIIFVEHDYRFCETVATKNIDLGERRSRFSSSNMV